MTSTLYSDAKTLFEAVRAFRNLPSLGAKVTKGLRATSEYSALCRAWEALQDRFDPDQEDNPDRFVKQSGLSLTVGDGTWLTLKSREDGNGFDLCIETFTQDSEPGACLTIVIERIHISKDLLVDALNSDLDGRFPKVAKMRDRRQAKYERMRAVYDAAMEARHLALATGYSASRPINLTARLNKAIDDALQSEVEEAAEEAFEVKS